MVSGPAVFGCGRVDVYAIGSSLGGTMGEEIEAGLVCFFNHTERESAETVRLKSVPRRGADGARERVDGQSCRDWPGGK